MPWEARDSRVDSREGREGGRGRARERGLGFWIGFWVCLVSKLGFREEGPGRA